MAIDKRGHALKPVRGYSFTGEDMNTRVPWLLKNVIFLTYPFISHLCGHLFKIFYQWGIAISLATSVDQIAVGYLR